MERKKIGTKIKKLRKESKLSQDNFARKANISYTTFTKIETGVIKNPSVFSMAKIAKALNVSLDDLIK